MQGHAGSAGIFNLFFLLAFETSSLELHKGGGWGE